MKSLFLNRVPALILALIGTAGCASLSISLPPVTEVPSDEFRGGTIIWHDLLTTDIEGSKKFYGGLFGWTFEEVPLALGFGRSGSYLIVRNRGRLIGGMVDTSSVESRVNNSQWVPIMSVASAENAARDVTGANGTIVTPVTDLDERGRIAVVEDSTGALFAMLETKYGDPASFEFSSGDFFWDEIWTNDMQKALGFYQSLGPYELIEMDFDGKPYNALSVGGEPQFGFMQDPLPGLEPTWASYIKVDDMSLLDRVAELGGTVLIPAEPRGKGEVALIVGPSGAGVVLQTWPSETE